MKRCDNFYYLVVFLVAFLITLPLHAQLDSGPYPMFRHDAIHTVRSSVGSSISGKLVWSYVTGDMVEKKVDISITKDDSENPVTCLEQFSYNVVVTNLSDENVANGVVVTDTLDPNTSFASVSVMPRSSGIPYDCSETGGVVTYDLYSMVPQEVVTIVITVDVLATAPATGTGGDGLCGGSVPEDLCNLVNVTSINDDNLSNNTDSEPIGVARSESAILYVPSEYPTIQQAVDAANDGDSILIAQGYYSESIDTYTSGKGLYFYGAGPDSKNTSLFFEQVS